ncbi:hypothetical protein SAMN05444271_11933 [Halohasta litchfieldiae]|uniref:Uncharacterized protein n=1 Tax=Halohasta litchfieldiae TaxID=1073996 RepID=A0A1H6W4B5_9EURY|nr:hypothetical protein SAMN05444271_11933 [Halohasta litchfieldiae]
MVFVRVDDNIIFKKKIWMIKVRLKVIYRGVNIEVLKIELS